MKKKKVLSLLLAAAIIIGLLPTTVFAADTDKAIMLDASGISGYDTAKGGTGYDYIYMGSYNSSPVKWRVLDDQTNTGATGLFLLSEDLLGSGEYGNVYFQQDYHEHKDAGGNETCYKGSTHNDNITEVLANAWQGSDAQAWCKDFAGIEGSSVTDAFSSLERGAILATTKSDGEFTSSTYSFPFAASADILNGDQVFFLSAQEAENANYGFTNDTARVANYGASAGEWWLRSPYADDTNRAGAVYTAGNVYDSSVDLDYAARPAFNLNLNFVLFTSAANNSGHSSSFAAPADYSGNEWKVTLKDNNSFATSASLSGNTTFDEGYTAETLTITHAALNSFTNSGYTNVTATLTDNSGNILYYGSINDNTSATSSAVTIPAGLTTGTYTLSVYGEDWNEANHTDYATGTPYSGQIIVKDGTAPSITTRPSDATVSEGGTATFTVAASGYPAPTYQWQVNTGSGFVNVTDGTGGTAASYTTPNATTDMSGWQYQCVVTNSQGSVTSDPATLTVKSTDATLEHLKVHGLAGVIDHSAGTITVTLHHDDNLPTAGSEFDIKTKNDKATHAGPVKDSTVQDGSKWTLTVTAESGATKTYTITIAKAENAAKDNEADIASVINRINNHDWTVAQATGNTKDAVKSWIENELAGMSLNDVNYTVTMGSSFTAAAAGSSSDADGTDGSFSFTVALTKGEDAEAANGSVTISAGVITATAGGGTIDPGPSGGNTGSRDEPRQEPAAERITVPVTGEEDTVRVSASVSGSTAAVEEVSREEIEAVMGRTAGAVEVDLSGLGKAIDTAELPVGTFEEILAVAESLEAGAASLEIVFPQGAMALDHRALEAIVEQAGSAVRLVLEEVGEARLNAAQQAGIADLNVHGGFEAYLVRVEDNRRISDFRGGTATFSAPFPIPAGLRAEGFNVWYVDDAGGRTRLPTWYADGCLLWSVGHCSDFIIAYDAAAAQLNPPQTGDAPSLAGFAMLALAGLALLLRRRRRA